MRPPHTHNLAELVTQVTQVGVPPGLDMDTAVYLTNVYRSRYPNEDGLLPHGDPTEADARRAVTAAAAVLDAARRALDVPPVT